ncbi:hypothetical protein EDD99_5052 [Streptomyces sp. 846.5]|nr:hypothetical protein [Streptomyces sp. 846.5]TDU06493.1 hypothetical protein EDD99_5052 [Streptomyces sp. 846.5]
MQNIPVDVAQLGRATVIVPPELKLVSQETGEIKKDRDGNPVYVVGIAVRGAGRRRASVIEVSVSGEPKGLIEGGQVQLVGLEALAWDMGDRHGISFRAQQIIPSLPAAPVKAGEAR